MKINKLSYLISLSLIGALNSSAEACSALIVGKSASNNHSMFIARNEDFGDNNWAKHLVYHPSEEPTAKEWNLGDGLVIPMPKKLYAYSALPDWDAKESNKEGKYFEERGVNEFNVALSATNSADVNEKANKVDPLVKNGLSEALIPSIILPQIKTAKEGVELLGKYLKDYGASEGNILYFADEKEIWMMEIGSGHHWIAVKVPDDAYVMVANALRIHNVDLDSPDVLHSEGLYEFVEKNKLLDNPNKKSFNFAKAFGVLGDTYNTHRVWLGQKMLSPSIKQSENEAIYPLFQKPDSPIDITKIKQVLSADFNGTILEKDGKRPMRVERQLETHIIEIRPEKPKALQIVTWQSLGVLSESLVVPLYSTMTKYPNSFVMGTDQYDPNSAYWQFRSLTTLANTNAQKYYPFIHKNLAVEQKDIIERFNQVDKQLSAIKAVPMMKTKSADFSVKELNHAYDFAKSLNSKIMTDLTKMSEGKKYTEKEQKAILTLPKE
ncbi:Dipeptidase [Phocoenobacter uteri]|uniref:Dipeptidase n=1 Tax=Phocoenobacter uteri TaxID=146806 RepID=A0A379CD51_9PAST|nr:C69 family dipeptidase [Phocoenobacter uteri]MDG6881625.1 dipeptidase [Phocoenobacter uteri]SUB59655.1 Dipeptidase [Phocoenobacter uteri]